MSASNSRHAYEDCYTLMDAALADGKGTRVKMDSHGAGMQLRVRLNTARRIDRMANKEVYQYDHPLYGRSTFDRLIFRVNKIDDVYWVYLEVNSIKGEVQGLSQIEDTQWKPSTSEAKPSPTSPSTVPGTSVLRRKLVP